MELLVVMLGVILGLVWFLVDQELKQRKQRVVTTSQSVPTPTPMPFNGVPGRSVYPTHLPRMIPPVQPVSTLPPNAQPREERISGPRMLQTWRSSVVGLVKLAQRNIDSALDNLKSSNFEAALEAATTSVENISRALLHCYGEKPDPDPGQEDALNLLARRFAGKENSDIKKTIGEIAQIGWKRAYYRELSTKTDADPLADSVKAKTVESTLDIASNVVSRFSEIIREHFATEIPELAEACPKCHAMEMSVMVMAFDESTVRCTCARCKHSWNEPRG